MKSRIILILLIICSMTISNPLISKPAKGKKAKVHKAKVDKKKDSKEVAKVAKEEAKTEVVKEEAKTEVAKEEAKTEVAKEQPKTEVAKEQPKAENPAGVSDAYLTDEEEAAKEIRIDVKNKSTDQILREQAALLKKLSGKLHSHHFEFGFSATAPVLYFYSQKDADLLYTKIFGFGGNVFFRLQLHPSQAVPRFLLNVGYDHFGGLSSDSALRADRIIAGVGAEWVIHLNHYVFLFTSLVPGGSYQYIRRTAGITSLNTSNFDFTTYIEFGAEFRVAHNFSLYASARSTFTYRPDSIAVVVQPIVGIILKFF